MLLFIFMILVFAVKFLKGEQNMTEIELIELALAKADSRLNIASKLIENARLELQTDLKEMYRKNHCVEKPAEDCKCSAEARRIKFVDCSDVYKYVNRTHGVYEVWPENKITNKQIRVYCDMTDGGGWTVIQRRGDFGNPSGYFQKTWNEYKIGFGVLDKEFWIGNDNIFALTNQRVYQIKIDLWDWKGNFKYAIYDSFRIDDETRNYRLHIGKYSNGTAGDSFIRGTEDYDFSTKDRDNDIRDRFHCASYVKGAWWFSNCLGSNLNGLYNKNVVTPWEGVCWYTFTNSEMYGLKSSVVKIRPVNF